MPDKIIYIEKLNQNKKQISSLLDMVPQSQRKDKKLQRLLAFRLKLDGFSVTQQYLEDKLEKINNFFYVGDLYNFLKNDIEENLLNPDGLDTPDAG